MIYHAKSVMKGTRRALVVVDMPFRVIPGKFQGGIGLGHTHYEGRVMPRLSKWKVELKSGSRSSGYSVPESR